MPLLPEAKNVDISVRKNFRKISRVLGYTGTPSFKSVTLTGLTASALVGTDAGKALESITVGSSLNYTRPTLDTIQDIRTTASPTFAGLHINSAAEDSVTLLTLESDISNTNEYNEILFKIREGKNYGAIRSCVGGTGDSYMSFYTTTNSGHTLIRQVTIQHNGRVGFGTYNPETLLHMVSTAPYLTLHNITEEDTDGGGESRIIGKREDGEGAASAAGQIEISHDGSGVEDELGKIVLSVNTGAGLTQALEIDSSLTATFAGVVQATDFAKTGWPVVTGATFSFDDATKVFKVTDGGSAYYYIDGVKYTLSGDKEVDLDDVGIAEGLWHIYFEGATLIASQAIWSFLAEDKALVAILYWDNTNNKEIFLGWEAHTFRMSGATHARLHYAGGARWEIGLLVSDAGSEHIDVSAGDIWDEDLNIPISDEGEGLFSQVLSPAQLPIYYRDGASAWRKYEIGDKAAVTDVGYLSGGNLKWNDATTTWSNETVGLNNYVAYYVVATNEQTEPVALIMGQRVDNKLTEAKANNVFAGLSLTGLPFEEMVVLARLILKDTGTYTLEEVLDLRAYNVKGNITSPLITQHAGLGGLNWSSAGHYFDAAVDFNAQNISNIAGLTVTNCCVLGSNSAVFQPTTNSATFFQVLDADGGTPIFHVDTVNERVEIGATTPGLYMLAPFNITGKATDIGDRHAGIWIRSKTAGCIVQINVRESRLEIGGGGDLDTSPAMSVDYATGSLYVASDIELGHASDTTITRVSAGVIAVEGTTVMMVGGVPTAHSIASHNDTTGTGAELNTLTDGSETTLHSHAGGADAFTVKIDAGAAAGYIGAASGDGVLRTTTGLSYVDGGDFITLGLSHLGFESLTSPTPNDRIPFWDNSAGTFAWLSASSGLAISGTSIGLAITGLTLEESPNGANDYIAISDGATHNKISLNGIFGQGLQTTASPTFAGATLTAPLLITGDDFNLGIFTRDRDGDDVGVVFELANVFGRSIKLGLLAGGLQGFLATDGTTYFFRTTLTEFMVPSNSQIGWADANTGGNLWNLDTYFYRNAAGEIRTPGDLIIDGGLSVSSMKSGTDQANAGASAGELYFDTNDDNTVKMGV